MVFFINCNCTDTSGYYVNGDPSCALCDNKKNICENCNLGYWKGLIATTTCQACAPTIVANCDKIYCTGQQQGQDTVCQQCSINYVPNATQSPIKQCIQCSNVQGCGNSDLYCSIDYYSIYARCVSDTRYDAYTKCQQSGGISLQSCSDCRNGGQISSCRNYSKCPAGSAGSECAGCVNGYYLQQGNCKICTSASTIPNCWLTTCSTNDDQVCSSCTWSNDDGSADVINCKSYIKCKNDNNSVEKNTCGLCQGGVQAENCLSYKICPPALSTAKALCDICKPGLVQINGKCSQTVNAMKLISLQSLLVLIALII